jgi:hypothetical protein
VPVKPMSSLLFACTLELINFARLKDFQSPAFLSSLSFRACAVAAHIVLMRVAAALRRIKRARIDDIVSKTAAVVKLKRNRLGLGLLLALFSFIRGKTLIFNQDLSRFYDALFRLLNVDLRL